MGVYYYCIICLVIIIRRIDMLGYVRRYVNKGEIKFRYIVGKLSNFINMLISKFLYVI